MATSEANKRNLLYLDRITLQVVPKMKYTLRLLVDNEERELQRINNQTWEPAQPLDASPTSQIRVEIQLKSGLFPLGKKEQGSKEIDCQELFKDYWNTTAHEFLLRADIVTGKHGCSLELQFSAEVTTDSLRSSLHKLELMLRDYSPLMNESTEKALEKVFKVGAAFSELNDIAKAAFSVAQVTFELLQEQNKYDQMPLDLLDRLQRILIFADKVADEIVYEETEILEKTIPRMFKVMEKVAKCSCDYVKRGRFERTLSGLVQPERIEEMDRELTKVIEDFDRAMNVEALCLAKETKLVQQDLLLKERLKPTRSGYNRTLCCMGGTRESILNDITTWMASETGPNNTYWIYGLPGIGKTSLAHSICQTLDKRNQLVGAFFCQRDDTNSSEPRNILPTLIYKLAGISPSFRKIVAERLRSNQNLTTESMEDTMFLDFIISLPGQPNEHSLAFVVDALDECGNNQTRPEILKALTDAAALAPWLKIIITSRPEADIERFFSGLPGSSHSTYDLATDQKASDDLRTFARTQFDSVASTWCLPMPWPTESDFNKVISRANGLFIFIKTLVLALEKCDDAEETLKEALQGSAGAGLESLYGLYSSILKAHGSIDGFWRVLVVITTAQYRPLSKEPIAKLTGVKPNLVEKWVNALSSLLYRDEGANGAIRVRHLSISDFFLSDHCDYRVNLREAHAQQGISCLETMVKELRFNICKLDDSRLANTDVKDLQSRIEENISDPLQYSSLYWSNHICFSLDSSNCDPRALGKLNGFFEGLCPLFWIEVLSILGMVPIGAPCLRRVITWLRGNDSTLLGRIQDVCRFIITFHTPLSISAPHTYISTRPFLPSQSHLSTIFCTQFAKSIEVKRGKLLSWPAPPLEWIGHIGVVCCMSYSPNGSHIVTGSVDTTIRIWDAETGTTVGEPLKGHTRVVWGVVYSPNGRQVVSGSGDGTIRIWDAETGNVVGKTLEHGPSVLSVAYSPNGRHIISGSSDGTIQIWDAEKGAAVGKPLEGHTNAVLSVAYSPDGRHIISGSADSSIRIWNSSTSAIVGKPLKGHRYSVQSVTSSPDGRHIVSGSGDNTIRIWDAETGAEVGNPLKGHTGVVRSVAYSPNGRHIVSGSSDKTIRIWDAATGFAVGEPLKGHVAPVWSVAYSRTGRDIISGSDNGVIRRWDAVTGDAVGEPLEAHRQFVSSVAFSPDGRHIISGSYDTTIRIWDADTGAAIGNPLEGHTNDVNCVARSPNGRYITSGCDNGIVRIWDAETGVTVGKPIKAHENLVWSIAFSPDGRDIISGSEDKTIRIWDVDTGTPVGIPLEGHTEAVYSVAYSPDGRHIFSGSADRSVRIWDSKTGATVGEPLEGHRSLVRSVNCSPDGRHIVSGSDDETIRIWDAETGATVGSPLEGHTGDVTSVAYSPNGQCIISGSGDTTIRIWDAVTGIAVTEPLKGHTQRVTSVAYAPDGRRIISGSSDMSIQIWDAMTGTAVGNPPEGYTSKMNPIGHSPDDHHIVPTSGGGTTHGTDSIPHVSIPISSSSNPLHPTFCVPPDTNGWVRDIEGGLLYWVPLDCRAGLHSLALLTIPLTSHLRSVSLGFTDFAFGTSWTQVFRCV